MKYKGVWEGSKGCYEMCTVAFRAGAGAGDRSGGQSGGKVFSESFNALVPLVERLWASQS